MTNPVPAHDEVWQDWDLLHKKDQETIAALQAELAETQGQAEAH